MQRFLAALQFRCDQPGTAVQLCCFFAAMDGITGWLASIATIAGGLTVALNLGSRVTGWGFGVLAFGSACWSLNAWQAAASSLLIANLAMAAINGFGVWRWLGRRTRIEQGSAAAMAESAAAPVPSLVSAARLLEAPARLPHGASFGMVIDLMLHCQRQDLAYAVLSFDGIGGVGEEFRAIPAERIELRTDGLHCRLDEEALRTLPPIDPTAWPVVAGTVRNRPAGAPL